MALTRDALLGQAAKTPKMKKLDIPDLGGHVFLKGLSGRERDEFEIGLRTPKGELRPNIRARAAVVSLCDEQGVRLFTSDDIRLVGEMRADILQNIFNAFQAVNGMTDADVKELGEASDEPTAGSGSSTNSATS
jgi:hypothetical protein